MFLTKTFLSLLAATASAMSLPAVEIRASCLNYVIISTRGTTEAQGPSAGFVTMIAQTLATLSGGVEYDTVYPADWSQDSSAGTADILRRINEGLSSCPNQKFALLGYSQGAAATVNALKEITPTSTQGAAVKAVFLIGDPEHEPGKQSNVDQDGGDTTDSAIGIEGLLAGAGIPTSWDTSGRVLDVCYFGDGVCSGVAITPQHLLYGSDSGVQSMGANFLISKLG